jgi:hypothetical protein
LSLLFRITALLGIVRLALLFFAPSTGGHLARYSTALGRASPTSRKSSSTENQGHPGIYCLLNTKAAER